MKILYKKIAFIISIMLYSILLKAQSFEMGIYFMQENKYDSACIHFSKIPKQTPFVEFKTGEAYFYSNKYDEAIKYLQAANERGINRASFFLFKTYVATEDNERALEAIQKHVSGNDKISLLQLEQDPQFIQLPNSYKQQIEILYSTNDRIKQEIDYLLKIGNIEKAYLTLQESNIDKESNLYIYLLAQINYKQGYLHKSIRLMNNIQEASMSYEQVHFYAMLMIEKQNYQTALELFEKALEMSQDSIHLKIQIAKCFYYQKQTDTCIQILSNYCSIFKNDIHAKMVLANCYFDLGKHTDALLLVNESISQDKGNSSYYYFRAEIYYTIKLYKESEKDLCMSLDMNPNNAETYFLRALTRISQNNRNGACLDMQKAYDLGKEEAGMRIKKICK